MKFKQLNSSRLRNVDIRKYLIDWDAKITRGKNFGKFQWEVKQLLRPHWESKIILEEFSVPAKTGERGRSIDIINMTDRIALEISGSQHTQQSDFFHRNKFHYFKQLRNDVWKENWAKLNGFEFVEIYQDDELNDELLKNLGLI